MQKRKGRPVNTVNVNMTTFQKWLSQPDHRITIKLIALIAIENVFKLMHL